MPLTPPDRFDVETLASDFSAMRDGLLPLLHAIQREIGHIPADAVPIVAQALNLSRAEVHGVVSFYHDFRTERTEGRQVKLCRAEACDTMKHGSLCALGGFAPYPVLSALDFFPEDFAAAPVLAAAE